MSEEDRVKEIESKIEALERSNFRIRVFASAIGIALLIVCGFTWSSIPERAKSAAGEKAAEIAKKYIDEEGGMVPLKNRATEAAEIAEASARKASETVAKIQQLYESQIDARIAALESQQKKNSSAISASVRYGELIRFHNKRQANKGPRGGFLHAANDGDAGWGKENHSGNYHWRIVRVPASEENND